MCQQLETVAANHQQQKMKSSSTTYTIKKVLKTFFKKQQKSQGIDVSSSSTSSTTTSCSSCEDLENLRNMQMEQQQYFNEIDDNLVNEKLADMSMDDDQEDVYVPVRFARTEAGTFFWTTNLQPVTSTIMPAADEDLLQPAYCYSNYQYPLMQYQDRWAQA